jgi:hypothetical protein
MKLLRSGRVLMEEFSQEEGGLTSTIAPNPMHAGKAGLTNFMPALPGQCVRFGVSHAMPFVAMLGVEQVSSA